MGFNRLGSFVLMLHSHLPYYRKAGMWPFGEENLYECMAETYLPLLAMLDGLKEEGIQAKITLGITPILAEQLADEHLQRGFIQYLETRLATSERDVARFPDPRVPHSEHLAYLARYYRDWYRNILTDFTTRYDRNLLKGFKALQDGGVIEITTSGATHGFSPLLGQDASIQAQFKAGVETYRRHFGRDPQGCWLPECAYRPAHEDKDPAGGDPRKRLPTEAFLYENGLNYFFTEYHAVEAAEYANERRIFGIYGDVAYVPMAESVKTNLSTFEPYWMKSYPVAVMGRNNRASFQVWSAAHGYPGDGVYREFHRKDDRSGLHYWRLTSKEADLGAKTLYDPVQAMNQTALHADHFSDLCHRILQEHIEQTGEQGLLMVSFDTELYGHWWFEGIEWLKGVLKRLHGNPAVDVQTAGEYLKAHPPKRAVDLPESTWGEGGHYWVWNNPNTEWMWPVIHQAEGRMKALADRYQEGADAVTTRTLNQALRELLLLQASDWPFLVTTFQAKDYAVDRFESHVNRFNLLCGMVESQQFNEAVLSDLEQLDNPFPNLSYQWYHEPIKAQAALGDSPENPSKPASSDSSQVSPVTT